jgi:hypothetical protein
MKRNLIIVFSAVLLISFIGCKKGKDGPPGTANVKFSPWFTPTTYQKDTIFGRWGFNYVKDVPEITQAILDSGTVLVYGKLLGYNQAIWPTNQVGLLPITITYVQGGAQMDVWSSTSYPGKLKIRFINDNNIYTSISTQHQFRYVIIPGGVSIAGRGISLSYSDICRMYNIPE